jgi:hypothetical protein
MSGDSGLNDVAHRQLAPIIGTLCVSASVVAIVVAVAVSGVRGAAASRRPYAAAQDVIVDKMLVCRTAAQAGLNVLLVGAAVPTKVEPTGGVSIISGSRIVNGRRVELMLVGFTTQPGSLSVDRTRCHSISPKSPLAAGNLGQDGTFTPTFGGSYGVNCSVTRLVRIHVRVTLQGTTAIAGEVLIEDEPRVKPIVFIKWMPNRFAFFSAMSCQPQH